MSRGLETSRRRRDLEQRRASRHLFDVAAQGENLEGPTFGGNIRSSEPSANQCSSEESVARGTTGSGRFGLFTCEPAARNLPRRCELGRTSRLADVFPNYRMTFYRDSTLKNMTSKSPRLSEARPRERIPERRFTARPQPSTTHLRRCRSFRLRSASAVLIRKVAEELSSSCRNSRPAGPGSADSTRSTLRPSPAAIASALIFACSAACRKARARMAPGLFNW